VGVTRVHEEQAVLQGVHHHHHHQQQQQQQQQLMEV
jgi:hypothetical protein